MHSWLEHCNDILPGTAEIWSKWLHSVQNIVARLLSKVSGFNKGRDGRRSIVSINCFNCCGRGLNSGDLVHLRSVIYNVRLSFLSGQAHPYLADDIGLHLVSEGQDVDSARPPTDRVLFHGRRTHLATEALLPPGHVFGTASQYTRATKTSVITVFGVNSKRFGYVASGAQCVIPFNCAIQILLLN